MTCCAQSTAAGVTWQLQQCFSDDQVKLGVILCISGSREDVSHLARVVSRGLVKLFGRYRSLCCMIAAHLVM